MFRVLVGGQGITEVLARGLELINSCLRLVVLYPSRMLIQPSWITPWSLWTLWGRIKIHAVFIFSVVLPVTAAIRKR